MQNRLVNEQTLKPDINLGSRDKNQILLDYTHSLAENAPLIITNAEANATFDKNQAKKRNENAPQDSTRRSKKQPGKGRKPRGKQEIQPISSNTNFNASAYHNESIMHNTNNYMQENDHNRIELENFSNKNSYAKYTKNLQFREKLPKKSEREHSTPTRLNLEYHNNNLMPESIETDEISKYQSTSVDQYKSYLNNPTWNLESLKESDSDHLISTSNPANNIASLLNNKNKKGEMRSSSISSSKISLISESTSSNELIGWSYQKTRDGKLYNMNKDQEWKQFYKNRYQNDRVEVELVEFKEEIEKKFKISKCRNFQFPRISKNKVDPAYQSVSVYNYKTKLEEENNPKLLNNNYADNATDHQENNIPNKKMAMMKTFDEENKHQLSKSAPKSNTSSKPRKLKHKRQVTLFKFTKQDSSLDRAKAMMNTNSN
jgi:hypothetical protein